MKTDLRFTICDLRFMIGARRVISAMTVALWSIGAQFAFADTPLPESRLGGVRELSVDELADFHARMFVPEPSRATLAALPVRKLNITHLPVIGNQGQLGSCSAFAAAYYYKTYQEARERRWTRPDPETHPERVASPMWAFNMSPQGRSRGGQIAISYYDAVDVFVRHGCATWEDMPYAATNSISTLPDDPAVWNHAMRWRAARMGRIPDLTTPQGIWMLKRHLADGDLAVIAVGGGRLKGTRGLTPNFRDYGFPGVPGIHNGVYYRDAGEPYTPDGHAMTVVGYDDARSYVDDRTGETRQGAFLLANSWGTGWGVYVAEAESGGFMWMAYDYVLENGLGPEAVIMEDRIAYEPRYVARIGVDAPEPKSVNLQAFELKTTRGRVRPFPWINGTGVVQRLFPFDVTDLAHPPVSDFELFFVHVNYDPVATITNFSLATIDETELLSSVETPVTGAVQKMISVHLSALNAESVGLDDLRIRQGAAAFADVNANGFADLIVSGARYSAETSATTNSTTLWLNQGDGTFVQSAAVFPGSYQGAVAWSDVNRNGRPDLWVAGQSNTYLFRNEGDGAFSDSGLRLPAATAGYLAPADYNRDGRADLALANADGVFVYRQEPDGTFSVIMLDPRGAPWSLDELGSPGMLAWGDIDGDGLPDLLATGIGENLHQQQTMQTVLYRNNGDDTFTILDVGLPDLAAASVAWTDFDNDGHDDVAISGRGPKPMGSTSGPSYTRLFRGRGDGTLEAVAFIGEPTGLYRGAMQWVDLDHSGRRDLLRAGRETHYNPQPPFHNPDYEFPVEYFPNRIEVWRNLGGNRFEEAGCRLPGVSGGTGPSPLAVADTSGDGSVDVFASGTRGAPWETQGHRIESVFVRNRSTVFPSHGGSNAAPTAPASLIAESLGNGAVRFNWSGATDDVTPTNGLRYILRVGTSAGAGDVVSGMIQPYEYGQLMRSGIIYRELPAGTLHWAVRTVDSGLRVSPWSAGQTVVVPAYTPQVWLRVGQVPEYGGTTDPAGTIQISRNSVLRITAHPATGFVFSHWGGDAPEGTTANPLDWTVADGASLIAYFMPKPNPRTPAWVETPVLNGFYYRSTGVGLLAFNNRLYALGGRRGSNAFKDMFHSEAGDGYELGEQWSRPWKDGNVYMPPWAARSHHGVQVFNNRMWVIGGHGGLDELFNDVWSSVDGLNWIQETAAAPWNPRYHGSTTVYDSKLWLAGGRTLMNHMLREVWSSSNGRDWTAVTTNAPWTANRSALLAFNGQLLFLAGIVSSPGRVWASTDGGDWTQLTDRAPWRDKFRAAVYDGRIVVTLGPDAVTDDAGQAVWESVDGIRWIQTAPQPGAAHWPLREDQSLVVAAGRLWQIGGRRNTSDWGYDDVWSYGAQSIPSGQGELRLSATPFDGGALTPPAGAYVDLVGSVMTVSAEPATGYRFDGWEGPVDDAESATTTVTLAAESAISARFVPDTATHDPWIVLTMAVTPTNAGTTTPGIGDNNIWYNYTRTIEAHPAVGYRFSHWSGPVANPYARVTTIRSVSNLTVTAHFRSHALAAGIGHTALVHREGTLWVWGQGLAGQSGGASGMRVDGLPPLAEWTGVGSVAAAGSATIAMIGTDALAWGKPWTATRPATNAWEVTPWPLTIDGNIAHIEAGGNTVLIIDESGDLWAAGDNSDDQLGFPGVSMLMAPARVQGHGRQGTISNIVAATVGANHSLAVDRWGRVWGWGRNDHGQIDPALAAVLPTAVPVPGLPVIRWVAAGRDPLALNPRSYAIDTTGQVWQWGAGFVGPQPVAGLSAIVALSAGGRHVLALDTGGTVYAWGENGQGQLGDDSLADRTDPLAVTGLPVIVEIAAGNAHSVALAADGRVFAWGDDHLGAVTGSAGDPVRRPLDIVAMNATNRSVALTLLRDPDYGGTMQPPRDAYRARVGATVPLRALADGRYAFSMWNGLVADLDQPLTTATIGGAIDITAQFGLRHDVDPRLTLGVSPANAGVVTPSAGEHDYARGTLVPLRADHDHRYRFSHWDGPVTETTTRETQVRIEQDTFVNANFSPLPYQATPSISAQAAQLLLLYADSAVRHAVPTTGGSWGERHAVTLVQRHDGQGPLSNIVQVVHRFHSLALTVDGNVFAWGGNNQGQCGLGFSGQPVSAPRPVLGTNTVPILRGIRAVAAGGSRSLALAMDGTVLQWGQVSGHSSATSTRPIPLADAQDEPFGEVIAIEAGVAAAVAIRADQTLWTWDETKSPAIVAGAGHPTAAAIGGTSFAGPFFLARQANGSVRAWGNNRFGQLGNGTTNTAAVPFTIPGLSQVVAVAAGEDHALALTADGRVFAWGYNAYGQLGDGTQTDRWTPVQVPGLTGIRAIAASARSSHALDADGRLYSWGAVYSTNPYFATLTPFQEPYFAVDPMTAPRTVRLTLSAGPPDAGDVFPGSGTFAYNQGQTVEIRALPAPDYRLRKWSDGNTNAWRTLTMGAADLQLHAEFILIEPTIRLDHASTGPGMATRMRLTMEDGKWPYAGFNAAILLPPGIDLLQASPGADLSDGFQFDSVTRPAPGGGTLLSLVAFSPDQAIDTSEGEWAVLSLRATSSAAGGALPVTWVDGRTWTRCPPSVLADTNGVLTIRPTLVPGSITVDVARRVHAALRVVANAAAVDRMSEDAFRVYRHRTQYLAKEPYVAEVWLRVTGTGTVGIVDARLDLMVDDHDATDEPVSFATPVHGLLFGADPGGTVNGPSIEAFGGAAHTSAGEGRDEWVRLGWAPVGAPRALIPKSVTLSFGDHVPALAGGLSPDDRSVLEGVITVRTLADLPRAALGTPHWWLDAYGLVALGVIGYDVAEMTDYRGDGFIARQAYIAGVDPTDPNARFIVAEIARGVNRDEISWPGVAGRRYRVYRATTLTPQADWTLMHAENCYENRIITYTYAHDLDAPRFYRIDVGLIE